MCTRTLAGASLAFALAGCTPPACHVVGTLTRGGQPMTVATINFEPDGMSGPSAVVPVKDGRFEVTNDKQLIAGKYKVRIGPAAWIAGQPEPENFAPYTTSAELKLGDAEVNFDMPEVKKK